MGKSRTIKISLLTLLASLMLARFSCAALSNLPFMTMAFIFMYGAAFIVFFFFSAKTVSSTDLMLLVLLFAYSFLVVFKTALAQKSLFSTEAFNSYIILFLTFIYVWSKKQSAATKATLLKVIFCGLIFTYVYSIIVLFFDPNASRISAATSVLEKSPYDILSAVGGFDAVYGGIYVFLLLLYLRKRIPKERKASLVLVWSVLLLDIFFILMAAFATAILLLLFAFFIYIGSRNKILSATGVILVILAVVFHESLGTGLMDLSQSVSYSETLSEKIYDFGEMLKTLEATGTYGGAEGRWQRMLNSLATFESYPLFGRYGKEDALIGGHSEFCDILGKFGLFGFFFISAFFVLLYKDLKRTASTPEKTKLVRLVFFTFIVAAILNPALYSQQMLPLILMIPLSDGYALHLALPSSEATDQKL